MSSVMWTQIWFFVALIFVLICSIEIGYRFGLRRHRTGAGKPIETGAVLGALLGLLGLLLGFSFSGATGRYMERQDLIIAEANAIGTAHLRADLLDEPYASELRQELETYTRRRVELVKTLVLRITPEQLREADAAQTRIWNAALGGVLAKPAVTVAVLNPVNEVLDLHSSRVASGERHLPNLVIGLLLACSVLTLCVVGYTNGVTGGRNVMLTTVIAFLIGAALWTTLDMDNGRVGLIRLTDAPHERLIQSWATPAPDSEAPPAG